MQNLRLFSRLDEAEFKKVDLHEGIESTIRLISQYYGPDRITLERDYADLPPVDCYAGQLNQVWMNLLVNAAQAITHEGKVRVATRGKKNGVISSVIRQRIGPEHLKKIFDPFFTTNRWRRNRVGLSITYGIIEKQTARSVLKAEWVRARQSLWPSRLMRCAEMSAPGKAMRTTGSCLLCKESLIICLTRS